ncbi:MAG: DUF1048 domain-containing protein [Actinomycetia bacterium]|nr:DUF1048 domain-containing protein [Actinomycetes bacterium]
MTIRERIIGDLNGKREWKALKARVKALPDEYGVAYAEIQKYIWSATGIETIKPLQNLVELFEESALSGRKVLDITGADVAAFVDELVYGERGYFEKRRQKLNETLARKLGKGSAPND